MFWCAKCSDVWSGAKDGGGSHNAYAHQGLVCNDITANDNDVFLVWSRADGGFVERGDKSNLNPTTLVPNQPCPIPIVADQGTIF